MVIIINSIIYREAGKSRDTFTVTSLAVFGAEQVPAKADNQKFSGKCLRGFTERV